jgi:hypothetical protein
MCTGKSGTAYIFSALIIAVDVYLQWAKNRHRRRRRHGKLIMDAIIIIGCVLSGCRRE